MRSTYVLACPTKLAPPSAEQANRSQLVPSTQVKQ